MSSPTLEKKAWFITGTSRGFGRVWAAAALERGDAVVATVRDTESLSDLAERHPETLLMLQLDVTDRTAVFEAIQQGHARFGRLDVVVPDAGFGLFGALEELTEEQARQQMEVDFFGTLWVLQATAPILREQRAGRVLVTSSFGGLISYATAGLYRASKYATEGLTDSFALEMQDFGVKVTLIEPAAYATGFSGSSADQGSQISAYDDARDRTAAALGKMPPGDPEHTGAAVLRIADMDEPPLRVLLGEHVLPLVLDEYQRREAQWKQHEDVADSAQ